jgi:hypothetical protein
VDHGTDNQIEFNKSVRALNVIVPVGEENAMKRPEVIAKVKQTTGVSEATVKRAITWLIDQGDLLAKGRGTKGHPQTLYFPEPADIHSDHKATANEPNELARIENLDPDPETPIAVDIETVDENGEGSLNPKTGRVAVITVGEPGMEPMVYQPPFDDLLKELENRDLIFHHAPFDLAFLKHHYGFEPKGNVYCTKVLSQIAHAGEAVFNHSLKDLVKR